MRRDTRQNVSARDIPPGRTIPFRCQPGQGLRIVGGAYPLGVQAVQGTVTRIGYIFTMSNDALLWNAPPPPPRKPRPAEHVWSMRKNGKQVDAELRGHGEYGWECQFLHDREVVYGRRWDLREQAIAEANSERQRLERAGWLATSRL